MVRLSTNGGESEKLPDLRDLCRSNRGKCAVILQVSSPEGWVTTIKPKARGVSMIDPTDKCLRKLESLLGPGAVLCAGPRGVVAP